MTTVDDILQLIEPSDRLRIVKVNGFVCEFLPAYGKTLDDLQQI